jgi:membrane protein
LIGRGARLAWNAFGRFRAHNGPDRAAAVSYYTLLSLLPLFLFVISVGALVEGSFDAAFQGSMVLFRGIVVQLDQATIDNLRSFVERAIRFQWPAVLLFAWTSRGMFASLLSALSAAFDSPGHGFAKGNLLALGMVVVMGLAQLVTMLFATLAAATDGLLRRVAGSEGAEIFGSLSSGFVTHVAPVLVTAVFFFTLYRFVPDRAVPSREAAFGAILATGLWEVAKAAFAYYVRHLAQYAGIFGALEGLIVLALWLELSVSILLYCAEVVALRTTPSPPESAAIRI